MSNRPGRSSNVRTDTSAKLLAELGNAHDELLAGIAELEAQTREDEPDADALAKVRWRLSRASRIRRQIVDRACDSLLEEATPAEAARVQGLRDASVDMVATSSAHVGAWTIDRVLADWEGYRVASAAMRRQMRERISTEKTVLYPLLAGAC